MLHERYILLAQNLSVCSTSICISPYHSQGSCDVETSYGYHAFENPSPMLPGLHLFSPAKFDTSILFEYIVGNTAHFENTNPNNPISKNALKTYQPWPNEFNKQRKCRCFICSQSQMFTTTKHEYHFQNFYISISGSIQ